MSALFKAGQAAGGMSLLLEAERVAQSFMKGVHGRRRVGMGESFWQFRPWQPGDARRDIDWRQSAKRDDVFVRQAEWEAAQTVWLWRDASLSMDFGIKKDYAEVLLLALGIILLNGGEQAALLGTDLAPQAGNPAIQRIFDMLPAQGALSETARPVTGNAHVVLISDFYFPLEDLAAFCGSLAERRVRGTLIQVYDPAEAALPYSGRVKFEDIEGLGIGQIDIPQVEAIRADYQQKFAAHQAALGDLARDCGWTFDAFSTDTAPEAALTHLYSVLSPDV